MSRKVCYEKIAEINNQKWDGYCMCPIHSHQTNQDYSYDSSSYSSNNIELRQIRNPNKYGGKKFYYKRVFNYY